MDVHQLLIEFVVVTIVLVVLTTALLITRNNRASAWRGIRQGARNMLILAALSAVLGILGFGKGFHLFHQLFFPSGNVAFDPSTSHLVQLYPTAFWWRFAVTIGIFSVITAAALWATANTQLKRLHG
jgi:integral membrane protein (TIGR01906 family)